MTDPFIFKVDPVIAQKHKIGEHIQQRYLRSVVFYFINSGYHKATNLYPWLFTLIDAVPEGDPALFSQYDAIAVQELVKLRKELTYVPDKKKWDLSEAWQDPIETEESRTGDCEDGAILLYERLRKRGIPANRLMLMAGDVEDPRRKGNVVGHCWLAYRPTCYPLNWVFLDWCYYADNRPIGARPFFDVVDKDIRGDPRYIKIWFAFNEQGSHTGLTFRF